MKIWTWGYFPFTMGGNVHRPIACEIETPDETQTFNTGKGYFAYKIYSPRTNKPYVVESTTGAIVGSSIKEVMEDIEQGDEKVMQEQIAESFKMRDKAEILDADKFWSMLK